MKDNRVLRRTGGRLDGGGFPTPIDGSTDSGKDEATANVYGIFFAIALLSLSTAQAAGENENRPTADYDVAPDIPYCTGAGTPLLMDIFIPHVTLRTPTPAVLWLHGGGWERGDKNGSSGARVLAAAGFVTASIYYRLSGDAKFPADIEDCKCAIRYLRANATKYGIDPQRLGVAGASSGGHLALLVGVSTPSDGLEGSGGWPGVSSRVQAVASYYGPTDLRAIRTDFGPRAQAAITKLIGAPPESTPVTYALASPVAHVAPGAPPILLVHGDGDTLVPFEQSKRMLEAYRRAGIEAELVKVGNANHDLEPVDPKAPLSMSVEQVHALTIAFFRRELLSGK